VTTPSHPSSAFHRVRVRHVADHEVGRDKAVRLEHPANLVGVTHQQLHLVSRGDERTHGV
jgi:hypothetical protein